MTENKITPQEDKGLVIVGIGASAGGLEALHAFFENVKHHQNLAYVCIQHLSPDHKSLMVELLSKRSQMNFKAAKNNDKVEAGSVYMIPSKMTMTVVNERLILKEKPKNQLNFPIDSFFSSLAIEKRNSAVGVILSGTGSDGTRGASDIHLAGGTILVQDPNEAQFDGMPRAAIDQGIVDYVLPGNEINRVIQELVDSSGVIDPERDLLASGGQEFYNQILSLLKSTFSIDYKRYKLPTILRRLNKRMSLSGKYDLKDYYNHLLVSHEELKELNKDLLIGVTRFFRDEDAWHSLNQNVIPKLFRNLKPDETLKIWSVGCSRGQEAFSIAIMLDDYIVKHNIKNTVKIFATDCNMDALQAASTGAYKKSDLDDSVPKHFIDRYFTKEIDTYIAKPKIRSQIIFSYHNATQDPPFHKVDLVICRNMLIYLNQKTQSEVQQFFRFSIKVEGFLFLGTSETIGDFHRSYSTVDNKWKIYKNIDSNKRINISNIELNNKVSVARPKSIGRFTKYSMRPGQVNLVETAHSKMMEVMNGASMIVDREFNLVEATGNYRDYITLTENKFSLNILKMCPIGLSSLINTGIRMAEKGEEINQFVNIEYPTHIKSLHLNINQLGGSNQDEAKLFLIFVRQAEENKPLVEQKLVKTFTQFENDRINELENQLRDLKEDLQNTIEHAETSNEELQATNEELLASNEELQSTNEELQSVNEELHTVNSEFLTKNAELTALNDDIDHLMDSTELGTLFLDSQLRIRRFTPHMNQLVSLRSIDIDRKITELTTQFDQDLFVSEVQEVMKSRQLSEIEIQTMDGKWFLQRITPYFTKDDHVVTGAVATFIDISLQKYTENQLQDSNKELEGFAYVASHDLKHPAINIASLIEMIQEQGFIKPEGLDLITKVKKSAVNMQETLSDLHKVIDIKGNGQLALDSIEIKKEIMKVINNIEELIKDNNAKIQFGKMEVDSFLFPKLFFESIVQNLLTNAIKYKSEQRDPLVYITTNLNSEGQLEMKIKDNGRGIDMERNGNKIFELFGRLESNADGKGVGLYLIKTMMSKSDGYISVDSSVGIGTTFTLTFNLAK